MSMDCYILLSPSHYSLKRYQEFSVAVVGISRGKPFSLCRHIFMCVSLRVIHAKMLKEHLKLWQFIVQVQLSNKFYK